MPKNVHVTDTVTLEGFQAILEPGKFGYSLSAVVDDRLSELREYRQSLAKELAPAEDTTDA